MKRTYRLENIDCANCAAKIEHAISRLDGVTGASINFFAQNLVIDADEERFDDIMKKALKAARRVEPDCEFISM